MRPTDLPEGWRRTTLGEFITLKRGYDLPSAQRHFGPVPIVSSAGVTGWHDEKKVAGPGVVTGRYGTLGEVYYIEGPYWPLNTTLYVKDFKGNDPRFVSYVLREQDFGQRSGAAAVPGINRNVLHQLPVVVPTPWLQLKISAVLSGYDELIENNTRRIRILEEMAQAIYREWFVEFRYPGHEDFPLVDSDLGQIPKGWNAAILSDLVEEMRRGVDPAAVPADTPYIGLEHMPEHSIGISDWGCAREAGSRKYRYEKGEILFGKIRPYLHKVSVPPASGICSTDAIVIRPRSPLDAGLALAIIASDDFVAHAVQTSNGTKMPRANWSVLERWPIALPPRPLLNRFSDFMDSAVGLIHQLVMANRNLKATRDLLLPRLISGEIDVSSLDLAGGTR